MNSSIEAPNAVTFDCHGEQLLGLIHLAESGSQEGVLIVVGGPQYRVGSHRQFVALSRQLARHGIHAMRFDYRGMGDSSGAMRTFENIDDDLRAAIDSFFANVPSLRTLTLWGLCDAASATLFYAHTDARVARIVLVNPWARSPQTLAKTYLRHYYLSRLVDPDLWRKIFSGRFSPRQALGGAAQLMRAATSDQSTSRDQASTCQPLTQRMLNGLVQFRGQVLLILSGDDLTAREFVDVTAKSREWRRQLASRRLTRQEMREADHTFSRAVWKDEIAQLTVDWICRHTASAKKVNAAKRIALRDHLKENR